MVALTFGLLVMLALPALQVWSPRQQQMQQHQALMQACWAQLLATLHMLLLLPLLPLLLGLVVLTASTLLLRWSSCFRTWNDRGCQGLNVALSVGLAISSHTSLDSLSVLAAELEQHKQDME
jgi:hypothetical protein